MVDFISLWRTENFQRRAVAWIDTVLLERGEDRVGPVEEFRVRFWSGVFRVPLRGGGAAWFKVANPGQAFEGELLVALARVAPGRVVEPWAIEPSEAWSLLPDGGPTLDWTSEDDWFGLINDVAVLQRRCQIHEGALAMLPSYEAANAADRVEGLVRQLAVLPSRHAQHVDTADADRYLQGLPRLREQMVFLDATGPRPSLQPNDAHPRNAVRPIRPGEPRRLFDLGDAVWSHPWAVLHLPGRGIAGVGLSESWPKARNTRRLVDAYAEHWTEIDRKDRFAVLKAAERLGALHRVESWRRLLLEADPTAEGPSKLQLAPWLEQALC